MIGLTVEFGYSVIVVILYLIGGYWTLFAFFVRIPLPLFGAMFLLMRGWKEKRDA